MILSLAFFMMVVSFSQKVRDLTWEQGVLRSIGLTQSQGNKIFFYEAATIVISSIITGITIGMMVVMLIAGLYAQLVESPRNTVVPQFEIGLIVAICLLATYVAVRVPAVALNKKHISAILKGGGS